MNDDIVLTYLHDRYENLRDRHQFLLGILDCHRDAGRAELANATEDAIFSLQNQAFVLGDCIATLERNP